LLCRKPYYTKGKVYGLPLWYCKWCESSVCPQESGGRNRCQDRRFPLALRPYCVTCHRHLTVRAEGWNCSRCQYLIPARFMPPPAAPAENPCCVVCHGVMRGHSGHLWKCMACNLSIVKVARMPRKPADLMRPWCLVCRAALACSGKNIWHCYRCDFSLQTYRSRPYPAERRRKIDGLNLLSFCLNAVPARFDDREDVVQELALRILSGKLRGEEVTAKLVRSIDKEIAPSNRFRDLSLETPNREGVRLEERLVR
jgi:hypothetical protein